MNAEQLMDCLHDMCCRSDDLKDEGVLCEAMAHIRGQQSLLATKAAEIAELQCEVDGFVSLSETHQAEIARLRAALEKIGNPDMYFRAEYGETAQWMGSGGKTPAEFARKALDGKP